MRVKGMNKRMEAMMSSNLKLAGTKQRTQRCSLSQLPLPETTRSYELFNCLSHALGVLLGIVALVWMYNAMRHGLTPQTTLGIVVYGLSLIALYAVSAIYHGLPVGLPKRVMRIADHCTIYLLIAGCYTPVALIAFWGQPFAPIILGVEWGLALVGIALNAWNMCSPAVKTYSLASYVVMGWAIVLVPLDILLEVGAAWLPWVAAGGIAYTTGIAFFIQGHRRPQMHCVWHVFVLLGSLLQLIGFVHMA